MIFGAAKAKARDARSDLADFAVLPDQGFAVVACGHAGYDSPLAQRVVEAYVASVEHHDKQPATYRHAGAEAVVQRVAHELNAIFTHEAQHAEWSYGASFVATWLVSDEMVVAHAGSCALLRWRQQRTELLAEADTLITQLLRNRSFDPEAVRTFPYSHVLVNQLGLGEHFVCHVAKHRIERGDRFLLTTAEVRHRLDLDDMMSASSPGAVARRLADGLCAGPPAEFGAAVVGAFPSG